MNYQNGNQIREIKIELVSILSSLFRVSNWYQTTIMPLNLILEIFEL